MKYGFFDDNNREYVITRPDTPQPWANYLGSPEYGAIISGNAGGYSFAKSGADGRILRYVFNQFDQPGRYVYIRDNENKDYWSASWQPVAKPLDVYRNKCRHGMGYTIIESDYSNIHTEAVYYVPLGQTYEVWELTARNDSDQARSLTISGYAEFTNTDNYENDQVNLQYSQFITRTIFNENRIIQRIHGNLYESPEQTDHEQISERFFSMAGADVSSYCGSKDVFLGAYRSYNAPIGVENGDLGNKLNYNGNSCGALSAIMTLEPGEAKTIAFILGKHGDETASEITENYIDVKKQCDKEITELKSMWHERFSAFQVHTPSPEFDTMINTWNAYNCYMTFIWSRAASFIYCGLRNGYGYRDTVQDIQGIIHLNPEMALEQIRFMLSAQVDNGGGLPLVKFTHNPGHEDTPDDASYVKATGHPAYRADDALWLFPTVYKYITETGNIAFLDEVIPYANKGEASVYEHLKKAIEFSRERLGVHHMPAGLYADWNDCLRLGAAGESSFVAMQFYYAYSILHRFAEARGENDYCKWLRDEQSKLGEIINKECWNEDRFIRGFTEDGQTIGNRDAAEASMWLNPQSWSVISGLADEKQASAAMENVYNILNTEYGAAIMYPPYHTNGFQGALMVIYNAGVKENGGIFSQTQGWLVLAEALLGHGNRAYEYYCENSPAMQNDRAEIRGIEPYAYGQFTESKVSPEYGTSHVHWLTGTASTMMVAGVEGLLGIRPDIDGIRISPTIPSEWDRLEINKIFRGKNLHIVVNNPSGHECGFKQFTVNGKDYADNYIAATDLTDTTEVEIIM